MKISPDRFDAAINAHPYLKQDIEKLMITPHDKHQERIQLLETIIKKLPTEKSNPQANILRFKFELMLQTTRDEEDEALSKRHGL